MQFDYYRERFTESADAYYEHRTFSHCTFTERLPYFRGCSFHDCDMSNLAVGELIECRLWNCNLSGANLTKADVRFSYTDPASPTRAIGCSWAGITAVNDCRWWGGLVVGTQDAYVLTMLSLIVSSPAHDAIYRSIPDTFRPKVRALLRRPFRTLESV
jgi:hypothetical protein